MITSKTSFLALIGNPVTHSLSPIIQNTALQFLGLDLIYIAIPCESQDLALVINSLKKVNCKGLNITIPYKEKVFNLCNKVSPIAEKLKAVNTLKLNSDKEWIGTNTDVEGFIYPIKNLNFTNKHSIVLGSGGASRSVVQGLINLNFSKITIISRNKKTLTELISNFRNHNQVKGMHINNKGIHHLIEDADLIINTTPVGMQEKGNNESSIPFGKDFWKPINTKTVIYDLIYNPAPTPLLKHCAQRGCITIDGREMLIAQGAKSLSFWTDGLAAPYEIMREALQKCIQ